MQHVVWWVGGQITCHGRLAYSPRTGYGRGESNTYLLVARCGTKDTRTTWRSPYLSYCRIRSRNLGWVGKGSNLLFLPRKIGDVRPNEPPTHGSLKISPLFILLTNYNFKRQAKLCLSCF